MAARPCGCLTTWPHDYTAAWTHGCMVAWPSGHLRSWPHTLRPRRARASGACLCSAVPPADLLAHLAPRQTLGSPAGTSEAPSCGDGQPHLHAWSPGPAACLYLTPRAYSAQKYRLQNNLIHQTRPPRGVQVTSDETAAASGQLSPVHWDRTGLLLQPRHLVAGTFRWARRPSMPACRPRGRYPAGALRCAGRREGCTGSTSEDPRAGHRESRTEPASGVCPRHRSI